MDMNCFEYADCLINAPHWMFPFERVLWCLWQGEMLV